MQASVLFLAPLRDPQSRHVAMTILAGNVTYSG